VRSVVDEQEPTDAFCFRGLELSFHLDGEPSPGNVSYGKWNRKIVIGMRHAGEENLQLPVTSNLAFKIQFVHHCSAKAVRITIVGDSKIRP
jgi:hypothetical protein